VRRLILTLTGLVLAVAVAGCSAEPVVTNSDADSQHFVSTVIPAVYGHWNVNALATVADKSVYTPQRLAKANERFAAWSKSYGSMVGYSPPTGTTRILRTKDGETKAASYDSDVKFQHATVTVHVDAVKNNGKWLVEGMSLQPLGHNNPPSK